MLEARMKAAAATNDISEVVSTMLALAPAVGRALRRPDLLRQQDAPGQPGPGGAEGQWGGPLTRVEAKAAATTILMVQHAAGLPAEDMRALLSDLRWLELICLRLAIAQPADAPPQHAASIIHSAARLAKEAAEREGITPYAQTPLAQLAQRCRAGLDADLQRMHRPAAGTSRKSGAGDPMSIWAAPLGAVLQALVACAEFSIQAELSVAVVSGLSVIAGIEALLAHEAAPRGTWVEADPDVVQGILAPLGLIWDDVDITQVLHKLARTLQVAGEQLPEAGSRQDPSRAAACTVARLGNMAVAAMQRAMDEMPLLAEPALVRRLSFSITVTLQRVNGLLQRRGRTMPLPVEGALFWAAHYLGVAALAVVRVAAITGLAALEQAHVQAAMVALARLNNCPQPVLRNFWRAAEAEQYPKPKTSQEQVMNAMAHNATVVREATEVVLEAAKAQPRALASQALLDTLVTAAHAHFGSARIESWYLLHHHTPRADIRVDLNGLMLGAQLVLMLHNAHKYIVECDAERCLGGACAQVLMSALEAAVAPGMPPLPTLEETYTACLALDLELRWGGSWNSHDPHAPDPWLYVPVAWAAFAQRLKKVKPTNPSGYEEKRCYKRFFKPEDGKPSVLENVSAGVDICGRLIEADRNGVPMAGQLPPWAR